MSVGKVDNRRIPCVAHVLHGVDRVHFVIDGVLALRGELHATMLYFDCNIIQYSSC